MSSSNKSPKSAKAPSKRSSTSSMSSKQVLQAIQSISGLIFGIFVVVHLFSTVMGTMGEAKYDETLEALRAWYQIPIAEAVIFISLFVHLCVGGTLHWQRDKFGFGPSVPETWPLKVVRWSGSVLGMIIFVHLSSGRLSSFLGKNRLDDFGHVHVLFNLASEFSFTFFGTLASLAIVHLWFGFAQILERFRLTSPGSFRRITAHWLFWLSLGCSIAAVAAGMLGFKNNPASLESIKYWTPHLEAAVPPFLRSPLF